MQKTINLGLKKPDYDELADIADINYNMDLIDEEISKKSNENHTHTVFENDISITSNKALISQNIKGNAGLTITANDLNIVGNTNLSGILKTQKIKGNANLEVTADTLYVKGNESLSGILTTNQIKGNTGLNITADTLNVVGSESISGGLAVSGKVEVVGDINMSGTLKTTKIGSDSDINVESNLRLGNEKSIITQNIKGNTGLNFIASETAVKGNMSVSGETLLAGKTTVTNDMLTRKTYPQATDTYDLGTSSMRYNNIYAKKLNADEISIKGLGVRSRTHIIVATYNTLNSLKKYADFTCTQTNATSILKQAIAELSKGGTLELLDGGYTLQYDEDVIEITKPITIKGSGFSTCITQPTDMDSGEAKEIFKITSRNVKIADMMICDNKISSPVSIIQQASDSITYENVFFILNGSEESSNNACITGSGDCQYTRIQNCRVYKGFNNSEKIMFDFSNCTTFSGVIGANISSGYNSISVNFANEVNKNNTAIYGHSNIDIRIRGV